ncbi:Mycobacterium terramassiliense ORFan [Mycobacterium terramassiliense]|uniref:Mycobacterium terramassiliense ORFan n=1 Tax=Mycobacterium terramassiliense TaxID=1841859 RepID=A0A2U3N559_9MYCO|nr:Mycobacterium terramassiliense ORFan [Mycobacterium terramassiliense]
MTPGWTRAARAAGSMSRTRFIFVRSIITRSEPAMTPALQFDAPPRVTNATIVFPGDFHDGDDLVARVRAQHQSGLLPETPILCCVFGQGRGVSGHRVAAT